MTQRNGIRQALYDYIMSVDNKDRGTIYSNLAFLDFNEVPQDTPTYWADKAYDLTYGNQYQQVYSSIMAARPEYRAKEFLLWASLDFDSGIFQPDFHLLTHWGDKAYQVGQGGEQG